MTNIFKSGSGDFMADYVINLFGNICELFIILFFFKDRYKSKLPKIVFVSLCIVFTIFQFLNTCLFLSQSNLVLLGSLLFIFLVTLLFPINIFHRFLFTLFIYLINALPEAIIGMTLTMLFNINIAYTQDNVLIFATCTLTSKFLSYVFVLITRKRNFKIDNTSNNKNTFWIYSLPMASLLIMILFLKCCYQIDDFGFQVIVLISSIVLSFANIAVFYIVDKLNELIETKEKLLFAELHINNQVLHYQELYKHQAELRIFRHDIKNRLVSLMALIKEKQTDKALQIMEKNLNWLEEMNSNIINSGNPVVDAIIQAKLHIAKDKNISLQISTKLAEEIKIDELELGIVLGNALDNAIEAVEKNIQSDNKYISMTLMSTNDRISISVSNPVEEDINTENLTTSKADKEKHGYGIKSIRAIAQKYDGIVLFTCEDKIFTVNINVRNYHT